MSNKNSSVFIDEDFLLSTETAKRLYHEYAEDLPIIDYHCHLPVREIADDKNFSSITEIWLNGDHYKWRAMRTNGVDEKFITGSASDYEKFLAWAKTVPDTIRNPLYHWTHMELKNPFGVRDKLLNENTAKEIWEQCNSLLQMKEFSTRGLLNHFKVEVVCTTDDPVDDLSYHKKIKEDNFNVKILPAFRPDKGMMVENKSVFKSWFEKLQQLVKYEIKSFETYIEAINQRDRKR